MTLIQVIKVFENIASHQPSVNMIVRNDVFRLNAKKDAKYGVFAWLQGQHSGNLDTSLTSFSFTFFYVDRLTSNLDNQLEVQSVGVQTLTNIIRRMEEVGLFVSTDYTLQPFNQRFNDECAGVYANVTIQVPDAGSCAESFGDFNDDFNEDFLIY